MPRWDVTLAGHACWPSTFRAHWARKDLGRDGIVRRTPHLAGTVDQTGHLHMAPELVVEVLSPDSTHERRDREVKLKLYARRGVNEY